MDTITHALSGATIAYTLPKEIRPWWLPAWAMLIAILPDADIFFTHSAIDYIKIHRSITHSLAGAWGLSFICTIPLITLIALQPRSNELPKIQNKSWSFLNAWLFTYSIIVLHIWLDAMNSYGTQVFLPFNDYRVRMNGLFIIDLLLFVPLIVGLIFWRKNRIIMILLLIWTIFYPLTNVGIRLSLEAYFKNTYMLQHQATTTDNTFSQFQKKQYTVKGVYLLPDAFTPFHWKLVLDNGDTWSISGYTLFTAIPQKFMYFEKPPEILWEMLKEKSEMFRIYEQFAMFPILDSTNKTPEGKLYIFSDLHFDSTIPYINDLQTKLKGEKPPFRIMAIVKNTGELLSTRFVSGFGSKGDTGWITPKRLN